MIQVAGPLLLVVILEAVVFKAQPDSSLCKCFSDRIPSRLIFDFSDRPYDMEVYAFSIMENVVNSDGRTKAFIDEMSSLIAECSRVHSTTKSLATDMLAFSTFVSNKVIS